MFPTAEDVRWFYDSGAYTEDDVQTFVDLGVITKEDYQSIVGTEDVLLDAMKQISDAVNK
ncbi:XkdX family protein [Enterococcus nangangensis]|uniref:XkdX family protein n=1 Tax=Enterococcus nangangensis TaxID=2559926 RepID=UPI0010F65F81|nr:XkdX family protein [Enterococcus nangangensis]